MSVYERDLERAKTIRAGIQACLRDAKGIPAKRWYGLLNDLFDYGARNGGSTQEDIKMVCGLRCMEVFLNKIELWSDVEWSKVLNEKVKREKLGIRHPADEQIEENPRAGQMRAVLAKSIKPPRLTGYEREFIIKHYMPDKRKEAIAATRKLEEEETDRRTHVKIELGLAAAGALTFWQASALGHVYSDAMRPVQHPEQEVELAAKNDYDHARRRNMDRKFPEDTRPQQQDELAMILKREEAEALRELEAASKQRKAAGLPDYQREIDQWKHIHDPKKREPYVKVAGVMMGGGGAALAALELIGLLWGDSLQVAQHNARPHIIQLQDRLADIGERMAAGCEPVLEEIARRGHEEGISVGGHSP